MPDAMSRSMSCPGRRSFAATWSGRLGLVAGLLAGAAPAARAQTWDLVWSDEFNGTSVNTPNWTYEVGGGGWGNNELEYYTSGANATVSGGLLTITTRRE